MKLDRTPRTIAAAVVTATALLAAPLQVGAAQAASAAPAAKVSANIPRGFDLDAGFIDYGADGSQQGPSKRLRGLRLAPCLTVSWKPERWNDRMAVRNSGPETQQVRELLTFTTARRAARVVAHVRDDLRTCPDGGVDAGGRPTTVKHYRAIGTGYDDVLWSVTAGEGQIGGYVAQVMRVGKAVVLNYDAGEYSGVPRRGAKYLNRGSQELAPKLCRWTVAGC